jgi:steroid 5-alpha reductase family enzyme
MSRVEVTLPAVAAVAALMIATWVESLRRHDASIVDPVWGPAFVIVALVAALAGNTHADVRWLLLGLTAAWSLRLGWHLARRKVADPDEDRRYATMRARQGNRFPLWSLRMIFGTQAALVLIVSLPLQVAATRTAALTAAVIPGVVVFLVGLAFEAIGDAQVAAFKADPASVGQVMDRGLWRYTRHPNYFGDCAVWWGLWLVALTAGGAWWTAVGPIAMSFVLIRVSGKALLEKDIAQRRPGYAEYIDRTSGFFPRPPRRV